MSTTPSAEALDADETEAWTSLPDAALRRGDALARQGRLDEALDAYAAARRLGLALSGERLFALVRLMAVRLRVNINNNNKSSNHSGEASRRTNLAPSWKRGEAGTAGAVGSAFAGSPGPASVRTGSGSAGFAGCPGSASVGSGSESLVGSGSGSACLVGSGSGSAGFAGCPGSASVGSGSASLVGSGSGSASLVRPGGLGGAARSGLGSEMSAGGASAASVSGLFDCCLCRFWLSEPVTLSCGHSCCRSCAELRVAGAAFDEAASSRAAARQLAVEACGTCGAVSACAPGTPVRVDVLLGGLLAKWFPRRAEAAQVRVEAARLFAVGNELRTTLEMCERALALVPGDVGALVMGSRVRLEMGDPTGAFRDAEQACRAQPHNAQAVVARGWSLLALGRQEEAVGALLRGLALDATQESAARAIGEILSEWLSPVPEQVGVASRSLKSGTFLQSLGNQPANHCTEGQVEVHKKRKHSASDSDCDGEGQPPHPDSAECDYISEVPRHRIDPSDLECSLCMRLLWEPVTTPCGHTFCTACLERSLDHRHQCPLCKEGLVEFLARAVFTRNSCLEGVMVHFLAEERRERERQNAEERKEMAGEVPIFVCTVAFPWVPCPLHVFEARYRLMLRRCIRDGTRSFGMCAWDQQHGFADVGCMLEVRGVHLYPDGRSLVSAVGGRRFQVTERSARDGYSTARVALLHDTPVQGDAVRELCRLHEVVRTCAERWFSKLEPRYHGRINQHFGDMPQTEPDIQTRPDGPAWLWWLIAVLPLEPRVQLGLLGLTSLPARLAAVAQLLAYTMRTHAPQSLQPSLPQRQPRQQQQQPSHQQQLQQQPSQQQPEQLQQQALQQQPNQHQPNGQPLQMLEPLSQLQFSPRGHQQEHHHRQQPCPSQQQPPCQQQQHRSQPQGQQHPQKQQPHTELHHQQQAQADVMGTPRLQGEPSIAMEEQPTASPWVAATQQSHVQPWGRPGKQPQGIQPNSLARSDSHPQQQAKPRVCMPPKLSEQLTKRLHTQQHPLDATMCTTAHTTKLSSKTAAQSNTLTTSCTTAHLTMQMIAHSTPHMTSQSTVHAISDANPHATATACAVARSTSNAAARATAYATAHTTVHAKTYAAAYTKVQTAEAMAHTAESARSTSHSDANSVGHTVMRAEGQVMACPATQVVEHKSRHVASLTDVSTRHTTKHTVTHRPTPTAENTQTMRHKATHTMAHMDTSAINNHQVDTHTIGHATSHPSSHPTVHMYATSHTDTPTDAHTVGHTFVHTATNTTHTTAHTMGIPTTHPTAGTCGQMTAHATSKCTTAATHTHGAEGGGCTGGHEKSRNRKPSGACGVTCSRGGRGAVGGRGATVGHRARRPGRVGSVRR